MKTFRVLVATDFSNESYNALFYVTQLLENRPCIFYILNVFEKPSSLLSSNNRKLDENEKVEALEKGSMEKLKKTFHRIHLDNKNELHEFQTLAKQGTLYTVISQTTVNLKIDLLVMGNKGNTGAKEIFMGSNTVHIIHNLKKCPLLAVPKEIDFKKPKEIAFITDLKKGCGLKTLEPLLELAKYLGATVKVLHISEEQFLSTLQTSNKKLLDISLKRINHDFASIYEFSDKAQVIDSFIKTRKVDMYSLVYTKKSFIERLFKKPVIMDLSIYADVPFLILPNRE